MARLKTAYRNSEKSPAETSALPVDDERIQPSDSVKINFDTTEPAVTIVGEAGEPGDAVTEALQKAVEADEAAAALLHQLAHLRASEQAQKDFAAQVAARRAAQMAQQQQQPPTHQQLLETWRSQGADEGDLAFLEANPVLMDNPPLCRLASDEAAQQGHQRGTEGHRQATKEIFDQHLARLQAQPAASAQPAVADPAGFFAPRPAPSPAAAHEQRASIVSAPVSRGTASYETGQRPPRQIKLSAEEQEYARMAGVSDVEYARQKQKLAQAKANGDYGERR